jgi:hypothetical protein
MSKLINGLPIKNATKSMLLHITGPDVKSARPKRPDFCVVAQAVKREMRAKEVRVHLGRVYVRTTASSWTRYVTPGSACAPRSSASTVAVRFALGVHTLGVIPPAKAPAKPKARRRKRCAPFYRHRPQAPRLSLRERRPHLTRIRLNANP